MKQSCNGSMSELCESRLKPCPGEREPVLRKLYIDLCNLIVESRIPGIDDRGYGEGIHCPPLMGPNSHCCDLSIPECQKHQKLIHRLLRSMKRNVFDVEVFMLPDCCRETKLAERIPKKEYVLLEQWSFNCFHGKLLSSIDVSQLLRAVRSFLYFSQISAWLSANEGKSPANIYYWVRPSSEVSTAKFESEPEVHRFPLCKVYEGLYGTIEVRYRTRTQYVPIIPCSKHPPQENPLITVIDNSDICLGSHIVKQLHKTCDTILESPISDKTITEPLSNVLMASNMPQGPVKAICGDVSDNISKAKGILKHSNCQIYSESGFGLVPKLPLNVDSDKSVRKSIKPLSSIRDEDVIMRHISSKNLSQRHNLTLPLKGEIRQRKLSRELLDSSSTDTDFSSLDSLPSSTKKSKRKRHSSKALITNSILSHINSSNSKVLPHSSLIRPEGENDGYDGPNGSNATSSDAINIHNLSKMKSCHFIEQNTLPNKVPLAVDFKKKDAECSLGSKNSLNLSQHTLRLSIENNWKDEKFSPISSKIIVSKCEPLLSQESSVPNRTRKSCRGTKRKASKCVQNSKYFCKCKNSCQKIEETATFEKHRSPQSGSESNVSHNFLKTNEAQQTLFLNHENPVESRKNNYKHKRMKKESKNLPLATASISSSHAKKRLGETVDSSKANTNLKDDSSKTTRVCNFGIENKHSAYNKSYLCSEDVQSKCLDCLTVGTARNSERRMFMKRKLNEKNDCYVKPDGEVSNKKTLVTVDESRLSYCPDSKKHYKLKTQRRRKITLKLSARTESKLQTLCRCSIANSNATLNPNLECCNKKRIAEDSKLYETVLENKSILNASQKSETEVNISCISSPIISVDVSIATGKSFQKDIQLQENCDLNTSKTKVQLTSKSAPEAEKNTYLSASNELICDYAPKPDRLLKSETANLYSGKRVNCFAERKLNTNQSFPSTKLRKGRRLLLNFEESILAGCLEPVKTVIGYKVEIGASGSFCPDHLTLPADVSFYELKSSHHTVPYMAHVAFENIEYYLPKKGSMQVTLFNPSETVVKMFVLNYDLSNMPPQHHTFIRQKTYYMPVSVTESDPKWLRYIIHLRFASSKTGRIFLHKDLKIVVLNRSNDDAACDHIQQPCELRSFLSVPKNPAFSSF